MADMNEWVDELDSMLIAFGSLCRSGDLDAAEVGRKQITAKMQEIERSARIDEHEVMRQMEKRQFKDIRDARTLVRLHKDRIQHLTTTPNNGNTGAMPSQTINGGADTTPEGLRTTISNALTPKYLGELGKINYAGLYEETNRLMAEVSQAIDQKIDSIVGELPEKQYNTMVASGYTDHTKTHRNYVPAESIKDMGFNEAIGLVTALLQKHKEANALLRDKMEGKK